MRQQLVSGCFPEKKHTCRTGLKVILRVTSVPVGYIEDVAIRIGSCISSVHVLVSKAASFILKELRVVSERYIKGAILNRGAWNRVARYFGGNAFCLSSRDINHLRRNLTKGNKWEGIRFAHHHMSPVRSPSVLLSSIRGYRELPSTSESHC